MLTTFATTSSVSAAAGTSTAGRAAPARATSAEPSAAAPSRTSGGQIGPRKRAWSGRYENQTSPPGAAQSTRRTKTRRLTTSRWGRKGTARIVPVSRSQATRSVPKPWSNGYGVPLRASACPPTAHRSASGAATAAAVLVLAPSARATPYTIPYTRISATPVPSQSALSAASQRKPPSREKYDDPCELTATAATAIPKPAPPPSVSRRSRVRHRRTAYAIPAAAAESNKAASQS